MTTQRLLVLLNYVFRVLVWVKGVTPNKWALSCGDSLSVVVLVLVLATSSRTRVLNLVLVPARCLVLARALVRATPYVMTIRDYRQHSRWY